MSNPTLTTFTTRVDTLFSVTFLVMAPENPLVLDITTEKQKPEVLDYIAKTKAKSDLERQINKEKTGVFTGRYVYHPLTKEKIPVWIADFVLPGYGTGVVMANAHDERDLELAKKYQIPLKEVLKPLSENTEKEAGKIITGDGILINSKEFDGLTSSEARKAIAQKLVKEGRGREQINYRFRDWVFSRQRYWGEPFPIEYIFEEEVD